MTSITYTKRSCCSLLYNTYLVYTYTYVYRKVYVRIRLHIHNPSYVVVFFLSVHVILSKAHEPKNCLPLWCLNNVYDISYHLNWKNTKKKIPTKKKRTTLICCIVHIRRLILFSGFSFFFFIPLWLHPSVWGALHRKRFGKNKNCESWSPFFFFAMCCTNHTLWNTYIRYTFSGEGGGGVYYQYVFRANRRIRFILFTRVCPLPQIYFITNTKGPILCFNMYFLIG